VWGAIRGDGGGCAGLENPPDLGRDAKSIVRDTGSQLYKSLHVPDFVSIIPSCVHGAVLNLELGRAGPLQVALKWFPRMKDTLVKVTLDAPHFATVGDSIKVRYVYSHRTPEVQYRQFAPLSQHKERKVHPAARTPHDSDVLAPDSLLVAISLVR
jgi:hypothetical protein